MAFPKRLKIDGRVVPTGKNSHINMDNLIDLNDWLDYQLTQGGVIPVINDTNFGNTNLTFTGDRFHDANGFEWGVATNKIDQIGIGNIGLSVYQNNNILPIDIGNFNAADKIYFEAFGEENSSYSHIGVVADNDDYSHAFITAFDDGTLVDVENKCYLSVFPVNSTLESSKIVGGVVQSFVRTTQSAENQLYKTIVSGTAPKIQHNATSIAGFGDITITPINIQLVSDNNSTTSSSIDVNHGGNYVSLMTDAPFNSFEMRVESSYVGVSHGIVRLIDDSGSITEYADNATAIAAGLPLGAVYRTGDLLKIVH